MAYQSLYRRYRPQTFAAIRGQQHLVTALQGAVRDDKVGHAYLFHGPRGTGKTTSARVLAKALNCENLSADGEPCGTCESCVAIEEGRSFDLHELDAASNNGVEEMRELLRKVSLGTPGRMKVYLLDEAHMLTTSASNALLKSLEEPPDHVIWVLATTEPHKLVATIRSRCQVFELGLLGAEEMEAHVRWVVEDAGLDVDDEAIDHVIAAGGGSVRDTLSALDRVVAAGGTVAVDSATDTLLAALADRDPSGALAAVVEATGRGRDPQTIGASVVAGLRDAFLTAMGSPPPRLAESDRARAERLAEAMTPAAMTRSLDLVGTALIEMRQAPDPRVHLDVAVVRACRPESEQSPDALLERIERLERAIETRGPNASTSPATPSPAAPAAEPDDPPSEAGVAPPDETDTGSVEAPQADVAPASPEPQAEAGPAAAEAALGDAAPSETPRARNEGGPAAAARRALAERKRSKPPDPAPAAAVAPPPVPKVNGGGSIDLRGLRPATPSEVVELAVRHLGLDKDTVVRRATEMLAPRADKAVARDPAELVPLWLALVDDHGPAPSSADDATPAAMPVPEAAAEEPPDAPLAEAGAPDAESADTTPEVEVPVPDDPDSFDESEIHLDDLVDAPSHTEDVIEQLSDAFPGAELLAVDEEKNQ